jgi:hypothetical protein
MGWDASNIRYVPDIQLGVAQHSLSFECLPLYFFPTAKCV